MLVFSYTIEKLNDNVVNAQWHKFTKFLASQSKPMTKRKSLTHGNILSCMRDDNLSHSSFKCHSRHLYGTRGHGLSEHTETHSTLWKALSRSQRNQCVARHSSDQASLHSQHQSSPQRAHVMCMQPPVRSVGARHCGQGRDVLRTTRRLARELGEGARSEDESWGLWSPGAAEERPESWRDSNLDLEHC